MTELLSGIEKLAIEITELKFKHTELKQLADEMRSKVVGLSDALIAIKNCVYDQDDIHRCRNIAKKALEAHGHKEG